MAFPPRRKTVRTCRSWQSDPWLQPGEKFCGGLWNGQSVWSQIVCDPFPGELRIVLARGEGGKGKKWETRSSGILQYCSASIRPLQTSTKLTFNQTTSFNHLQLQGLKETYGIGANPADLLKRPFQPWTPEAWSRVGPGSAGSGKIMDTNDSNDTILYFSVLCLLCAQNLGRKSSRTFVSNGFWRYKW